MRPEGDDLGTKKLDDVSENCLGVAAALNSVSPTRLHLCMPTGQAPLLIISSFVYESSYTAVVIGARRGRQLTSPSSQVFASISAAPAEILGCSKASNTSGSVVLLLTSSISLDSDRTTLSFATLTFRHGLLQLIEEPYLCGFNSDMHFRSCDKSGALSLPQAAIP